jgi:hypothetical protein
MPNSHKNLDLNPNQDNRGILENLAVKISGRKNMKETVKTDTR